MINTVNLRTAITWGYRRANFDFNLHPDLNLDFHPDLDPNPKSYHYLSCFNGICYGEKKDCHRDAMENKTEEAKDKATTGAIRGDLDPPSNVA